MRINYAAWLRVFVSKWGLGLVELKFPPLLTPRSEKSYFPESRPCCLLNSASEISAQRGLSGCVPSLKVSVVTGCPPIPECVENSAETGGTGSPKGSFCAPKIQPSRRSSKRSVRGLGPGTRGSRPDCAALAPSKGPYFSELLHL